MPPDERKRPAPTDRPSSDNTECTESYSYVQGLHRRRAESYRLPVLESGRSEPHHYAPPTRGYPEAAEHLLAHGLTPAADSEGLQAMRKRGGRHYRAAKVITERWGLAR